MQGEIIQKKIIMPERSIQLKLQNKTNIVIQIYWSQTQSRYCCGKKTLNCRFNANICCELVIYVSTKILFVTDKRVKKKHCF